MFAYCEFFLHYFLLITPLAIMFHLGLMVRAKLRIFVTNVFLYFDNCHSFISSDTIYVIRHYIWHSSKIYSRYSPTSAVKIVHNIILRNQYG